jgi:hypothetical protein
MYTKTFYNRIVIVSHTRSYLKSYLNPGRQSLISANISLPFDGLRRSVQLG